MVGSAPTGVQRVVRPLLLAYLPPMMLVATNAALLWLLVALARHWEPHLTHSAAEVSILRRCFAFLLFNSFVLPALALSSLSALLGRLLGSGGGLAAAAAGVTDAGLTADWNASLLLFGDIFLQSSASYFVAYTLHRALLTTALQLWRAAESAVRLSASHAASFCFTRQWPKRAANISARRRPRPLCFAPPLAASFCFTRRR